jgi:hypothetical protein
MKDTHDVTSVTFPATSPGSSISSEMARTIFRLTA